MRFLTPKQGTSIDDEDYDRVLADAVVIGDGMTMTEDPDGRCVLNAGAGVTGVLELLSDTWPNTNEGGGLWEMEFGAFPIGVQSVQPWSFVSGWPPAGDITDATTVYQFGNIYVRPYGTLDQLTVMPFVRTPSANRSSIVHCTLTATLLGQNDINLIYAEMFEIGGNVAVAYMQRDGPGTFTITGWLQCAQHSSSFQAGTEDDPVFIGFAAYSETGAFTAQMRLRLVEWGVVEE